MKKKEEFDFEALGESLRADTQEFLDTYGAKYPDDGPLLAFCLYFDSQGDINSLVLPQRAVSEEITIDDTATWFKYSDHADAPYAEHTEELISQYEEWFHADRSDKAQDLVIAQFMQMITWVVTHLSFEKVPKTEDFIFHADAMDEEYDEWNATIPPALLKKHFGQ